MVGTLPVPMPARVLLVAAALVVPLLAGCTQTGTSSDSSGDFKGEARLVANTIEDLQSAGSKGHEDEICTNLLAAPLARRMGARGGTCAKAVDAALKDTDTFALDVQSVHVDGTRATARVKADRGDRDEIVTLALVKSGPPSNGWRISDLG
jgi:hypothetical protein